MIATQQEAFWGLPDWDFEAAAILEQEKTIA